MEKKIVEKKRKPRVRHTAKWVACAGILILLGSVPSPAAAQGFQTLLTFSGSSGANPGWGPNAGLLVIGQTLYGTTEAGGAYNGGEVFSVPVSGGSATILTSFNGGSGVGPAGGLTLIGSALYGTTWGGGAYGDGTVFSLPLTGGSPTVLTSFSGANGESPQEGLTLSGTNLYGVTYRGGASQNGTVFSLPVSGGTSTALLTFSLNIGESPSGSLVLVGSNFYGSALVGGTGSGYGTVFRLPVSGGTPTVLTSFSQIAIGANPIGSLVVSGSVIYGIAEAGGPNSAGELFSIPVSGGTPTAVVAFPSSNGEIGTAGVQGNLILSGSTFYGTTGFGGAYGNGMVFEVNTDGSHFNDLVDFSGSNGHWPNGLTLSGSTLYGTTITTGSNGYGTVYSLNVLAARIGLTGSASATIITGGTATLGMIVANSAPLGNNNLQYTLTAAFQSGSGTLGAIVSGSGSLAPSASQSCAVAATSTNLGNNTLTFTASDPNALNSPQTASATLTVLGHAAPAAAVIAGNGFLIHVGASGVPATISLSNTSGTRSTLEVNSVPSIAGGTLSSGPAAPYYISPGSAQTYTALFSVGGTAGVFSDPVTFSALGDNQSLSGANPLGTLTIAITGNVFSGNGVWTASSSGSLWNTNGNWTDANGSGVQAVPGSFAGFTNTDSAAFSGSGSVTVVNLGGTAPSLNALSLSNSNYTLSGGSLTFNGGSGTATVTVSGGTQSINAPVKLATNTIFAVNSGALFLNSVVSGSGGLTMTGSGTATLAVANAYTGPTTVQGGLLVLQGSSQSSSFTAASGGSLQVNTTLNLNFQSLTAQAGGTVQYNAATINGGYLRGPGAHVTLPGTTNSFNGTTTYNSTVFQQNGADNFTNFTNGGQLANNAVLNWSGGVNASSGQLNVNAACNVQDFTNNGGLTVNSGGTLNNSVSDIVFGGGSRTTINPGGQLNANSDGSGSAVDLNGALLVNNGTLTGTTNVNYGSLAQGSGTYGPVNVYNGGRFKPGNSPGSVTTGPVTWNSGGQYLMEMNDATGAAGTNWNLWNINGSLALNAGTTPNSQFTLVLESESGGAPGMLADFDDTIDDQWLIAETSNGISGFNPAEIAVDASGFANNLDGGHFSVAQEGNQVDLVFTVPEPSTLAILAAGGIGLAGYGSWRRRAAKRTAHLLGI